MTLEDFEKELAKEREAEEKVRDRGKDSKHRHHHHHHHRDHHRDHHRRRDSSRSKDQDESKYDEDGHRAKRSKNSKDDDDHSERRHKHRSRRFPREGDKRQVHDDEDDVTTSEKASDRNQESKRDAWMEAPSSLDVDYVQRNRPSSPPKFNSMEASHELKLHKNELNHHLHDLQDITTVDELANEPSQHEVSYTFGDAGSNWRMTKLRAVYRQAKETNRKIDEVAIERYGNLRDFDDAREEETELGRRETYGAGYVGKNKPSGELFQERKLDLGLHRSHEGGFAIHDDLVKGIAAPVMHIASVKAVDQSALNKMKAQMLRARMMRDPKAADLEKAYSEAMIASEDRGSDVVTLSAMDNRMLSGAPRNEVKAVGGRRAQERGQVEENEEMSIEDMVREERRTRGQAGGDGQRFAERIAKDAKFDNDLDYMDENATKLAKKVHKSEISLRNTAIGDFQKLNRILDNCPLCNHEDTGEPPVAPMISLATRTYLTLPTEPELSSLGAVIVPTQHRTNLLECDDDEWEEIRNFMKSITRLYHDQGRDVIFYENAAFPNRKPHAALNVVPLPYSLGETAPAFFQEAFLTSEDEWSQHKKIIDTLAKSKQGLGKLAFRRSLAKEMPYFHVWFQLDGGIGHVVEDSLRWPKGDLFAREIIGGMLDLGPEIIRRQGRWHRGPDGRVDAFKKKWRKFDWTRVLTEG